MNTMSNADIKLSKGLAPAIDPKRAIKSALTGQTIGVWWGEFAPKGSK